MAQKYFYNGTYHSVSSLERLSGISRTTLTDRLQSGWPVELAIMTPPQKNQVNDLPPEMYKEGNIDIVFTEPIPGVFKEMQPTLNKVYAAEPHCPGHKQLKSKLYYIITLDNGKPLIVYPNEFKWLGNTTDRAA